MFHVRFYAIKSNIIVQRYGFQMLFNNKQLCKNLSNLSIIDLTSNKLFVKLSNNKCLINNNITRYSTDQLIKPNDPDTFGDISGNKYGEMELDDDEKELEEFEKDESQIPRRFRLSSKRYAQLISDHIGKGDLHSAMDVLELVKNNRDKPTTYMYNLLIRGFAIHGNLKKSFKLYNDMKRRGLKQNNATYTSIFNACANSSDDKLAIDTLNKVRHELMQKNISINPTHYNVMIKAYSKHKCLIEAFQLVDDMVDKRISPDETTFNSLLFASISDKDNGLRHALIVWHLMQQRKIKPSILTYNLLLRAIRDTKFGTLKINDQLIDSIPATQINLTDSQNPDLLSTPPTITSVVIDSMNKNIAVNKNQIVEYKSSSSPSKTDNNIVQIERSMLLSDTCLNDIHDKNRLILFGGYTGFIERMEKHNVTPDVITLTLLMEIVPASLSIEKDIIDMARVKKIPLDIDFFNMLIKKRSTRRDYKNAKKVLDEIQIHGVIPNIITWGVLAMGCQTHDEARALLQGMDATGHTLNSIIATTLISNACAINHFMYVLDMMELMSKNRVKPTEMTYRVLDHFQKKISDIVLCKVESKHSKNPRYKELFSKFNLRYNSWQQQFERETKNTSKRR